MSLRKISDENNFKDVKVSGQSKRAYPSTSKTRRNEPSHYFGKLGLSFTKTYMVGCVSSSSVAGHSTMPSLGQKMNL